MKNLSILLLSFLLAFNANSQSLLFKVSENGMQHPVYIFGTIHVFPSSKFFIDDLVLEKLQKSEKLVLEIDLSNPNLMAEMVPLLSMQGKSLKDLLTPEEFEIADRFFTDSLAMPLALFENMKPLFISTMIIPFLIGEEVFSYEEYLKTQAQSFGLAMGGLETVEEQMGYIDRISLEDQARMFMEQFRDISKTRSTLNELISIYMLNDAQVIYDFGKEHSAELPEFSEYLLAERNQNWIPQIIQFGAEQPTFVAVGAGHLGGENGVINLLRKAGFRVEPLK